MNISMMYLHRTDLTGNSDKHNKTYQRTKELKTTCMGNKIYRNVFNRFSYESSKESELSNYIWIWCDSVQCVEIGVSTAMVSLVENSPRFTICMWKHFTVNYVRSSKCSMNYHLNYHLNFISNFLFLGCRIFLDALNFARWVLVKLNKMAGMAPDTERTEDFAQISW